MTSRKVKKRKQKKEETERCEKKRGPVTRAKRKEGESKQRTERKCFIHSCSDGVTKSSACQ